MSNDWSPGSIKERSGEALRYELQAARNHRRNIDREYEVLKNAFLDLCNALLYEVPQWSKVSERLQEIKESVDNLYPAKRDGQ